MRRISLLVLLALMVAPFGFAQESRVGVGAFFDYFRLGNADQNFFGVGGRLAVNPHANVGVEFEAAHYFRRSVGDLSDLGDVNLVDPGIRITPALVGFTVHNNSPVRVFGTLKGGILHFSTDDFNGIGGFFDDFGDGTTRGALYPAAGIELGSGRVGLRFEVGDMIYWLGGAQHNLRFNVGPQFRF
ncbi:MAG: hypothetical protein AB7O65_12030 [Candidatus Korobacteraceae bacterium]